jgi:hypothetical protein
MQMCGNTFFHFFSVDILCGRRILSFPHRTREKIHKLAMVKSCHKTGEEMIADPNSPGVLARPKNCAKIGLFFTQTPF